MRKRQYKFDVGDWVAQRDHNHQWKLAGKIVKANSDEFIVLQRDGSSVCLTPDDAIVHVYWRNHRWYMR